MRPTLLCLTFYPLGHRFPTSLYKSDISLRLWNLKKNCTHCLVFHLKLTLMIEVIFLLINHFMHFENIEICSILFLESMKTEEMTPVSC